MEFALVHNNQLILGPIRFNVRMINSELEDLELRDRISPKSYLHVPIHFSDGITHLLPIERVRYSPVVAKNKPELKNRPYILGATIDGDLRVLYSPYDIEAGWLDAYYPLIRGYEPIYAQKLGLNIITYVMTH